MPISDALHMDLLDDRYAKWKKDPRSVSEKWRLFFEGFDIGLSQTGKKSGRIPTDNLKKQAMVEALKHRYRDLGHLLACLDPLTACPVSHPYLELEAFGLSENDLAAFFHTRRFSKTGSASLKRIIRDLRETYCRSVGVEYMHLQDPKERNWLRDRMESGKNSPDLNRSDKIRILEKLIQSGLFEQFLNKKYVGVTRFSLEGGDGVIPVLDALVRRAAADGCREIIFGMAHRGRLNVQSHIFQKPLEALFAEFEHCYDPDTVLGAGDVKYHNGYMSDITTPEGNNVRMALAGNPSHLEAVDPVVEGLVRARQDLIGENGRRSVLPVLIHGDAAFAGQGVTAEVLNMSQLAGYRTGGTIHIIINNQIGYTTLPVDARSTRYSTDIAKMLMVPTFHVHGEDPEALVHVIRLAADYRMTFGKDVVVDVVCYRRYGHNEGDEPYFTQPLMYGRVKNRPALHTLYGRRLVEEKVADEKTISRIKAEVSDTLNGAYDDIHGSACLFPMDRFYEKWDAYTGKYTDDSGKNGPVKTGIDEARMLELAEKLAALPKGFSPHRKLKNLLKLRLNAVQKGEGINWANAETLAFASLVTENTPIRLSGQDCGRGTFSQRHSVLFDTETGASHIPLNHLSEGQAPYEVFNSPLSEYGVLGFEYGYAMARPEALVIWEAQFGDFANNAQGIIDLFITSGESKWRRLNHLVLLLPHGMDGLGPEHSNARPERFLQLCAEDNIQVVNTGTPAQYFHLLRRQILRNVRKPLIIMTPKSLLRHPAAVSRRADFTSGHFQEILVDKPEKEPTSVLFCSGKIYYALAAKQKEVKNNDTAIIRLEQLYPFPEKQLGGVIESISHAGRWTWVQEEPENMGPWAFVRPRLESLVGERLSYAGRPESASPATGIPAAYRKEQEKVTADAFSDSRVK